MFKVGDEVIYIDDDPLYNSKFNKNTIYKVQDVYPKDIYNEELIQIENHKGMLVKVFSFRFESAHFYKFQNKLDELLKE